MRYAIVSGSMVVNVVLWDGVTPWAAPEGTMAIACGDTVGPGWTYNGSTFSAPVVPE